MNALEEKFGARGLSIVGVTSEGRDETEKWVAGKKAKHAYAYDKGGSLASFFGVRGIPHAVLVDPDGTILWRGHPAQLNEGLIEKAVSGAIKKPLWELGKEQEALRKALQEDNLAGALQEAQKAGAESVELVRSWIDGRVAAVSSAVDRGDYLVAVTLGERLVKSLRDLPEAEKVSGLIEGVRKDPEKKALIKAQEDLSQLETDALSVQSKKKAAELVTKLRKLAKDHPGTLVAERATSLANHLDRK